MRGIIFLPIFLAVLIAPVFALDGWNYYREVTITNNVAQDLTDYQVNFTLDTANLIARGKMRSDCGDLRVTLSDGQTLLPYWIDPATCNTNKTVIWTKVPSIPASSSTKIYVWYGNPIATSQANGDAVFLFFDDFSGTSLNTTKWTIARPDSWITISVSDGLLTFSGTSDGSTWKMYILKSTTVLPDLHEIIARVKWSMSSTAEAHILNYYDSLSNMQQFYYDKNSGGYYLRTFIQGNNYATFFGMRNDNPTDFEYYKLRYNGSYVSAHRSLNGVDWTQLLARNANIFTTGFTVGLEEAVLGTTTNYYYVDYVAAKKYIEPEPSVSVGNENLPLQFPSLNWSITLTGNPLQDIITTPAQYFAPFAVIVYGVIAIFVFGIAYIRTGKLYSAIAYTITLFAAILSFFTQNLYISLILYTIALFSLAAALYITFGKRDIWG